jgi:hypothetical protein
VFKDQLENLINGGHLEFKPRSDIHAANTLDSRPHHKRLDKASFISCSLQRDSRQTLAERNSRIRHARANRGCILAQLMRSGDVMMSTARSLPLESDPSLRPSRRNSRFRWAKWSALVTGLSVVAILLAWSSRVEPRAIRELPSGSHQVLPARLLAGLQVACSQAQNAEAMRDFCSSQPHLVLEYPECGKACQGLAKQEPSSTQVAF